MFSDMPKRSPLKQVCTFFPAQDAHVNCTQMKIRVKMHCTMSHGMLPCPQVNNGALTSSWVSTQKAAVVW